MITSGQLIQRSGATTYSNAALSAGIDVVTAGANINGVIVRTLCWVAGSSLLIVGRGAQSVLLYSGTGAYLGAGLLIPPGFALRLASGGGNIDVSMTYDVL